jgi:hypothetical protein
LIWSMQQFVLLPWPLFLQCKIRHTIIRMKRQHWEGWQAGSPVFIFAKNIS